MKNAFQKTANAFYDAFETRQRDNGEAFHCLADDAAEWMRDAIFAAHENGARLPCDAIYTLCHDAAEFIAEHCSGDDHDDGDAVHEFADGAVTVYNGARAQWLADDVRNAEYIDDAIGEGLASLDAFDIFQAIGAGMYLQAEQIFAAIYSAIQENADEFGPAFVAGWNMPGYMPECEPAEFDEFDDAKAYIIEFLKSLEDDHGVDADYALATNMVDEFERLETLAAEYCHAAEDVNLWSSPDTITAGAFAFWIVENDA